MSKVTTPSTVDGHLGTVTDNRPSEALAAEGVPMRARWACAVLAAILALGACGGDSSEDSTAAAEGPDASGTDGEALATAVSIDANVDVSLAAAEFTSVDDPVPVEAGDVVRTDSSGFAEVTYFDGSLTRLDVDTSFTVIELTDTPDASVVRTDMGIGRTWNRVEELSGDDQFIVETAVATATVRGTAFLIDCPDDTTCTFTVIEGTIELTLPDGSTVEVEAPSSVTVTDGQASDPVPAPWDTTFGQDWILDNGERDTDMGFAAPADIYETHGPQFASLDGVYSRVATVTSLTCEATCPFDTEVGRVEGPADVEISLACGPGPTCTGTFTALESGAEMDAEFDGQTLHLTRAPEQVRECGELTYAALLAPTAAELREGRYVVTALAGTAEHSAVITGPPAGCAWFAPATVAHAMELTRSGGDVAAPSTTVASTTSPTTESPTSAGDTNVVKS